MTESRFMFRRIVRVAFARFVSLGADESGVALAVTILMFSLLFLSFASVYAIGTATREKIHLQNAADAAAYSAAVVQADTLSRLATINRAMAWTYVQQTRREMDYIVYKWLNLTMKRYNDDANRAMRWNLDSPLPCPDHRSGSPRSDCWGIGADALQAAVALHRLLSTVDLNGSTEMTRLVELALLDFKSRHLLSQSRSADLPMLGVDDGHGGPTYGLAGQIVADGVAIAAMNMAEQQLVFNMKSRMRAAAESTLDANVPEAWKRDTFFCYHHDDNGFLSPSYLRLAQNNADDERQFCAAAYKDSPTYADDDFQTGINKWFILADGRDRPTEGDEGLQRAYLQTSDLLRSSWSWFSLRCYYISFFDIHIYPIPETSSPAWQVGSTFPWYHNCQTLGDEPITRPYDSESRGYEPCYETARAMPWFVQKKYFSSDGTVSVGVAKRTDNVWNKITGTAQGLFAAFTPSVQWTWAFSSAKAGYHRPSDPDPDSRVYDISWRGDSQGHGFETVAGERKYWNLCETDWDAVFLPVSKTKTMADAGRWTDGSAGFMQSWVTVTGTWTPLGGGSVDPEMARVPAPPGVGGGRSNLDWGGITDVMYH